MGSANFSYPFRLQKAWTYRLWKRHSWELLSSALTVTIGSVMNDRTVGQQLSDAGRVTAQQIELHYPSFRDVWTLEIILLMSAANSQRITGK